MGYFCLSPTSYLTFDILEGEEYVDSGIVLGGADEREVRAFREDGQARARH